MSLVPPLETAVATYYDRPMLKEPVWIWTVPAYFYVGGVAGASLVLGAAAQLSGDHKLTRLVRVSRWIGASGQALGSIFLIADLGRPERFFNMLRVFNYRSPLSIGSWILTTGGSAAAASIVLPNRAGAAAGIAAGVLAIPLAGYTGVLLSNSAIPVWQRARHWLPALFVASSVASCTALFDLMNLTSCEARVTHTFGLIGKSAELMCMQAVERELSQNAQVAQPLRSGATGALWTASKALTAASLALALVPGSSKTRRAAGVLGTLAGIAVRFAVVYAGVRSSRDPRAVA